MAAYPQDLSSVQIIHQYIEYQAIHQPNSPALTYDNKTLSYKALNEHANQLAHYLISIGVTTEKMVGVVVNRSLDMVVSILAILKASGVYVPVDPEYPSHRVEYIFADSKMNLLITEQDLLDNLPSNNLEKICMDRDKAYFSSQPKYNPLVNITGENLAYLLYTSGSTGNPKGVMVSHNNLIETFKSWKQVYQLSVNDCHLQMASFSFDVFSGDLIRALCSGAKLVLCPKNILLRPEKLFALMQAQAINCAEFIPTVIRRLLKYAKTNNKSLSFMRLLLCGSDSWSFGEYRALKEFCGASTRVINSYGLTEATIDSTWYEEDLDHPDAIPLNQYVPIGKPFPHTQIFLLDEQLNPVPDESVGEIYISGAGVARGYYEKPALNKERFIIHQINSGEFIKLYKTGDQGRYLPNSNIQFLGRIDNQVKVRGIRIELSEIEHAINNYPTIRESIVILNDEPNHPRFIAYVVIERDSKETLSELRHFLAKDLPSYMIPSSFIEITTLPLTPNGKKDRKILKSEDYILANRQSAQVEGRVVT